MLRHQAEAGPCLFGLKRDRVVSEIFVFKEEQILEPLLRFVEAVGVSEAVEGEAEFLDCLRLVRLNSPLDTVTLREDFLDDVDAVLALFHRTSHGRLFLHHSGDDACCLSAWFDFYRKTSLAQWIVAQFETRILRYFHQKDRPVLAQRVPVSILPIFQEEWDAASEENRLRVLSETAAKISNFPDTCFAAAGNQLCAKAGERETTAGGVRLSVAEKTFKMVMAGRMGSAVTQEAIRARVGSELRLFLLAHPAQFLTSCVYIPFLKSDSVEAFCLNAVTETLAKYSRVPQLAVTPNPLTPRRVHHKKVSSEDSVSDPEFDLGDDLEDAHHSTFITGSEGTSRLSDAESVEDRPEWTADRLTLFSLSPPDQVVRRDILSLLDRLIDQTVSHGSGVRSRYWSIRKLHELSIKANANYKMTLASQFMELIARVRGFGLLSRTPNALPPASSPRLLALPAPQTTLSPFDPSQHSGGQTKNEGHPDSPSQVQRGVSDSSEATATPDSTQDSPDHPPQAPTSASEFSDMTVSPKIDFNGSNSKLRSSPEKVRAADTLGDRPDNSKAAKKVISVHGKNNFGASLESSDEKSRKKKPSKHPRLKKVSRSQIKEQKTDGNNSSELRGNGVPQPGQESQAIFQGEGGRGSALAPQTLPSLPAQSPSPVSGNVVQGVKDKRLPPKPKAAPVLKALEPKGSKFKSKGAPESKKPTVALTRPAGKPAELPKEVPKVPVSVPSQPSAKPVTIDPPRPVAMPPTPAIPVRKRWNDDSEDELDFDKLTRQFARTQTGARDSGFSLCEKSKKSKQKIEVSVLARTESQPSPGRPADCRSPVRTSNDRRKAGEDAPASATTLTDPNSDAIFRKRTSDAVGRPGGPENPSRRSLRVNRLRYSSKVSTEFHPTALPHGDPGAFLAQGYPASVAFAHPAHPEYSLSLTAKTSELSLRTGASVMSESGAEDFQPDTLKLRVERARNAVLTRGLRELADQLAEFNDSIRQSRQDIIQQIREVVQLSFNNPQITVEPYGSFETGLLTPFSDVDLAIQGCQHIDKADSIRVLELLEHNLKLSGFVSRTTLILTSSVPLLKIDCEGELRGREQALPAVIKVDIIVNVSEELNAETSAFRTTSYIRKSVAFFRTFPVNVLVLKVILNYAGLSNSYTGAFTRRPELLRPLPPLQRLPRAQLAR